MKLIAADHLNSFSQTGTKMLSFCLMIKRYSCLHVALAPVDFKTGVTLALPPSSNEQRAKLKARQLIGRAVSLVSPTLSTTQHAAVDLRE
jgi:hypothetical protein